MPFCISFSVYSFPLPGVDPPAYLPAVQIPTVVFHMGC